MGKWVPILAVVATLFGNVQPAAAGCFASFARCMQAAAREANFWWRTVLAIDCEIDLSRCLKDGLKWW